MNPSMGLAAAGRAADMPFPWATRVLVLNMNSYNVSFLVGIPEIVLINVERGFSAGYIRRCLSYLRQSFPKQPSAVSDKKGGNRP